MQGALQKQKQKQKPKEEEYQARRAQELYRHQVLEQIEQQRAKHKNELKAARAIPDIAGNQGYPPIYERPPQEQREYVIRGHREQKEALLRQVGVANKIVDGREEDESDTGKIG